MKYTMWRVVPVCEKQRRDVRQEDLLQNGLYRKCAVYRGGGGYDRFPAIYREHHKGENLNSINLEEQFIIQLQGCHLECPYCYVTRDGVHGPAKRVSTESLLTAFRDSGLDVLHLMGGAPAFELEDWKELLKALPDDKVFTSDFMLTEKAYSQHVLDELAGYKNAMYAVSFKGFYPETYKKNTGRELDEETLHTMISNLIALEKAGIDYYCTFTNMEESEILGLKDYFSEIHDFRDSFAIDLVAYNALKV